jgi:hypothetical protein
MSYFEENIEHIECIFILSICYLVECQFQDNQSPQAIHFCAHYDIKIHLKINSNFECILVKFLWSQVTEICSILDEGEFVIWTQSYFPEHSVRVSPGSYDGGEAESEEPSGVAAKGTSSL